MVGEWFGILQRKRLAIAAFPDIAALASLQEPGDPSIGEVAPWAKPALWAEWTISRRW